MNRKPLFIEKRHFDDIQDDRKTFEIRDVRHNIDVGDIIHLTELDSKFNQTGRVCTVQVKYVTYDSKFLKTDTMIYCFDVMSYTEKL